MSEFARATISRIPNLGNRNRASIPLASKREPYMQGEHFKRHWQSSEGGKLIRNTSKVQMDWSKILISTIYSKCISNWLLIRCTLQELGREFTCLTMLSIRSSSISRKEPQLQASIWSLNQSIKQASIKKSSTLHLRFIERLYWELLGYQI
jgi:hypothetical protein